MKIGLIIVEALRGALKGLPTVNALIELKRNRQARKVLNCLKEDKDVPENVKSVIVKLDSDTEESKEPHSYVSILFQLVTSLVAIYLILYKGFDKEQIFEIVKFVKDLK